MQIDGLQKVTLLDFPGKIACTVFFSGCNLRCPFCHNASLVLPERRTDAAMEEEAFFDFLTSRRGKLEGVCVTGGEPSMQRGLAPFLARIKEMGFSVKLDTNGSRPEVLRDLVAQGLVDYVAMDIKNSPEKYAMTCGGADILSAVRESTAYLMSGAVDYEFRTTVVDPIHTEEDIRAIGAWLRGAKRYYLQSFVDSGDLIGEGMQAHDPQTMERLRAAAAEYIPAAALRGI